MPSADAGKDALAIEEHDRFEVRTRSISLTRF